MKLVKAYYLFQEGGFSLLRDETGWFLWRKFGPKLFYNQTVGQKFFRLGMRVHRGVGLSRYTDADPFKYIYVDPNSIQYYYSGPPRGWGRVVGGEWDLDRQPLSEHAVFSSIKDHFVHGTEWKNTDLWDRYLQQGLSREEISSNLNQIESLYESIKTNGYKSQQELLRINTEDTHRRNNDAIHPVLNEVAVNIFRDGELGKKYSGNHRLAIARALGIDQIPVLVRTRHRKWQQIRDEIRRSEAAPSDIDKTHPDLNDLFDNKPGGGLGNNL